MKIKMLTASLAFLTTVLAVHVIAQMDTQAVSLESKSDEQKLSPSEQKTAALKNFFISKSNFYKSAVVNPLTCSPEFIAVSHKDEGAYTIRCLTGGLSYLKKDKPQLINTFFLLIVPPKNEPLKGIEDVKAWQQANSLVDSPFIVIELEKVSKDLKYQLIYKPFASQDLREILTQEPKKQRKIHPDEFDQLNQSGAVVSDAEALQAISGAGTLAKHMQEQKQGIKNADHPISGDSNPKFQ